MSEITMDQLRSLLAKHIRENHKTQTAFAKSVGMSRAHVCGVLSGRKAVPLAWAELVGATVEVGVTVDQKAADWARKHDDFMGAKP